MEKYHKVTRWPPTLHLCEEDRQENELALKQDLRIFSAYILPTQVKVWVITEWDRSVSTLLLPEEY